jgi:DNA repair protein RadA/Sms
MMKKKTVFFCSNCGNEHSRWMGQCGACGEWNTLVEKTVALKESKAVKAILADTAEVVELGKVELTKPQDRITTGFQELNSVLGGGFIDDQVVLISGEPGVGKSTLLLQVLVSLNLAGVKSLYVSGEESAAQIKHRAQRLFGNASDFSELKFVSSPAVQDLIEIIEAEKPQLIVVDSVQTIYDEAVAGLPGSISQVRAATAALVSAAKKFGFVLILVGHINKDGEIAGPKVLEHLVDTVIQFEGDRDGQYRVLRILKNRFGSTGEVGLLVMTEAGLVDMTEEHNIFDLAEPGIGTARTLVMEGNRPLVVQVQALVNNTVFAYPKRIAEGISASRLHLIIAIIEKFAGARLSDKDVYVRTAGGYKLLNQTSDLAIAAAILSSLTSTPIKQGSLFVGELSLSGNISVPAKVATGIKSAQKFGVGTLVTGKSFGENLSSSTKVMTLAGVSALTKFFSKK